MASSERILAGNQLQTRLDSHFSPLDGIRGLAIFLVMADHLGSFEPHHSWELPIAWLNGTGWIGVDLFFVLSGFLITGVLLKAKGKRHYFRNFYMRRALRIFPVNYLYLFAFTAGIALITICSYGAVHEKALQALSNIPWVWFYLANVLIAKNGAFITSSINHFWSLAVEEQFYLFWPALVLFLTKDRLLKLCGGLVIGSLLFRIIVAMTCDNYEMINHVTTFARLDQFACGAAVALLLRRPPHSVARLVKWQKYCGAGALLLVVGCEFLKRAFGVDVGYVNVAEYSFAGILFATLIGEAMMAAPRSLLYRFCDMQILRNLGKYSYALYVIHFPLLIASNWVLWSRFEQIPFFQSQDLAAVMFRAAGVGAVSYAVAWLSWRYVEKPFLNLKRHFS